MRMKKLLLLMMFVLAIIAVHAKANEPINIPRGSQNWQPSYSGKWPWGNDITYWWTDLYGAPLELDNAGHKITYTQNLPNNDVPVPIHINSNASDIGWQSQWWKNNPNVNAFCATVADSTALSQVGGIWVSDIQGFAENHGELLWQSGFVNFDLEETLYYAVDLSAYYTGGAPLYPDDESKIFNIVDGTSSELPGYVFGTSPVTLDPINGLVTADPYSGDLTSVMLEGICPEPATLLLLGLGGLALRKRKQPQIAQITLK